MRPRVEVGQVLIEILIEGNRFWRLRMQIKLHFEKHRLPSPRQIEENMIVVIVMNQTAFHLVRGNSISK